MTIADFGGPAKALAISTPADQIDGIHPGSVLVIEDDGSLIFSDGFEFGDTFLWSESP